MVIQAKEESLFRDSSLFHHKIAHCHYREYSALKKAYFQYFKPLSSVSLARPQYSGWIFEILPDILHHYG